MAIFFKKSDLKLSEEKEGFYKNNQKIIREEGKDYTKEMFESEVKFEISKFINQSFDNIVVLAGAGASVVLDENHNIDERFGNTVYGIAKIIDGKLSEDQECYSLKEISNICQYLHGIESTDFNLEDLLSNILLFEKFMVDDKPQKVKYQITKNKILQIIKEKTTYDFVDEKFKHKALLNTLSKKIKPENKLTIVTTNYDTLFEEAAEQADYTVFDGFSFSAKPKFNSDMFEWKLVKEVAHARTKEFEYKRNVIDLLKIHGSLTWKEKDGEVYRDAKANIDNPVMIFPSSNKYSQSYQNPYFELLSKFQEILKKPNTLLITTGFSFADNHIHKMISQAIRNNFGLSVLVTDYDIEQKHSNWQELEGLLNNRYQIAFLKATLNNDLVRYLGGE